MTYDYGHASFADSAGARNVLAAANPLTPGGMNPRNTHMPTLAWAVLFVLAALVLYHFVTKGSILRGK